MGRTFSSALVFFLTSKGRPGFLGALLFGSFVSKSPMNVVATVVMYYKMEILVLMIAIILPFKYSLHDINTT